MNGPVEQKVKAGAAGAAGGGVVSTAVLWLAGGLIWGAPLDAAHVQDAIAAVPVPVAGVVMLLVPAVVAFAAAFQAEHTERPDLGES